MGYGKHFEQIVRAWQPDRVNATRSPLVNGDIFQAGASLYVLVAQACDLAVRSDGSRNATEGFFIRAKHTPTPGEAVTPAVKMSYLTGAVPINVALSRVQTVTSSAAASDEEIKLLAQSDIRSVLAHRSRYEPLLIAGVATETLELLLAVPDLDVLYVPVGAGSGAAGACIVGRALRGPHLCIVGVQSTGAPAVYESWRAGALLELPRKGTIAAGLDSRVAFELPLAILTRYVDAIVLVEDGEIIAGMRLLFETCRQVAEPAGAAAMAAAYKLRQQHQGRKVGIILSGGNVDPDMFRRALAV